MKVHDMLIALSTPVGASLQLKVVNGKLSTQQTAKEMYTQLWKAKYSIEDTESAIAQTQFAVALVNTFNSLKCQNSLRVTVGITASSGDDGAHFNSFVASAVHIDANGVEGEFDAAELDDIEGQFCDAFSRVVGDGEKYTFTLDRSRVEAVFESGDAFAFLSACAEHDDETMSLIEEVTEIAKRIDTSDKEPSQAASNPVMAAINASIDRLQSSDAFDTDDAIPIVAEDAVQALMLAKVAIEKQSSALRAALPGLIRLGDFVGNVDEGGASGLGRIDRSEIVAAVNVALSMTDAQPTTSNGVTSL